MSEPESSWDSRLSGWLLVAATVPMGIGATIPFVSPSLREAPWSDVWEELATGIAGNPTAWRWANGLFLAAAVLTALGLAGLSARLAGRARMWGLMGVTAFGVAATLSVIDRTIAIAVAPWAAGEGLAASDATLQAFIRLDEGLSLLFFILGFASVVLFGVALSLLATGAPTGRVVGGVGVAGMFLAIVGFAIPAFVYLATLAIGILALRGRFGLAASAVAGGNG